MKNQSLIYVFGLALLLAATASLAHPPFGAKRGGEPQAFGARMAERLGLDDQQIEQIKAIRSEARDQKKQLSENLKANRQALREAASFDQYDAQMVAQLSQEQGLLHAQRVELAAQVRYQTMAVLTPEQRETLASLRHERGKRGHGGRRSRDADEPMLEG